MSRTLPTLARGRSDGKPLRSPSCDSPQPDLSPVGEDVALAEKAMRAALTGAIHAVQDHASARQLDHAAVLLVDDLVDATEDAENASREAPHFDVVVETPVLRLHIQRGVDLFSRFHLHELTGLQIECLRRSRLELSPEI